MIGIVLHDLGKHIKPNYKKGKDGKKIRIQTTISSDIYFGIIQKYLPEYEHLNALLEEALVFFDKYRQRILDYGDKRDQLLIKLVREVDMAAFSVIALEDLSSGDPHRAIRGNGMQYALEWYYSKPLSRISLDEAINAIKEIWIATNRVHDVNVNRTPGEIHMLFHSKLGPNSDRLLCESIKTFLEENFDVRVDYRVFHHGYSIIINF
jgi:hypothetical protein